MRTFAICFIVTAWSCTPSLAQGLTESASLWGKGAGFGAGLGAGVKAGFGGAARGISGSGSGTGVKGATGGRGSNAPQMSPAQRQQAEANASARQKLAKGKEAAGSLQEAAALFTQLADFRERTFGSKDRGAMDAYGRAGELSSKQGRSAEAETAWRKALAVCARRNGPGSPESLPLLSGLRESCQAQGKLTDAASFAKQELALKERANDPSAGKLRLDTAQLCLKAGDLAFAETCYSKALQEADASAAGDTGNLKSILQPYAETLKALGKDKELAEVQERLDRLAPPPVEAPDGAGRDQE